MRAVPAVFCFSCLVLGCGGQTNGARSNASAAHDAANASSSQANVNPDVDARASTDANDAEASCGGIERSSVWIGQTDTTVSMPRGDYDGGDLLRVGCFGCWEQSPTVPDSRPEKVVLILKPITDWVTGTITFGEDGPPSPPTDPMKQYPPPTRQELPDGTIISFGPPWTGSPPYPGFSYSLISSHAKGNVLHLAFVPSEVFQDWCALQEGGVPGFGRGGAGAVILPGYVCDCDGGACGAATGSIDRIDLASDCDTMQGQLILEDSLDLLSSGPVPIRLQRVQ